MGIKTFVIMDYEKRYKEALQRARELNSGKDVAVEAGTTTCEYIFPELKESKDVRIRQELKHYLDVRRCQTNDDEEYINCNHFIDWLEKQGKKLDPDKVIEWLCNNSTLFGAKWCKKENIIEQFKEDFEI